MESLGGNWLRGYGEVHEVECNGNATAAQQVAPLVRDLAPIREGQRLIRLPDWDQSGPYMLMAEKNNRILRMGVSVSKAGDYLAQLGMRPFDIDVTLYHAELWARRHGSQPPLYPIREGDKMVGWDVWTEQEVVS